MQEKYLIDGNVLQKVVDYLTTKPFNEVNQLIVQIQQNAQVYKEPDLSTIQEEPENKPKEGKK